MQRGYAGRLPNRFGYFDGDGEHLDDELIVDPRVVGLCSSAFERDWSRATDRSNYKPARVTATEPPP